MTTPPTPPIPPTLRSATQTQADLDAATAQGQALAAVARVLATPLTVVLGRLERLQRHLASPVNPGGDEPRERVWLRDEVGAAMSAAARLETLLEEITDTAHLHLGQPLVLRRGRVELGPLAQSIAADCAPLAAAYGQEIEVDADAAAVLVTSDHARLARILHQLLARAIADSPPARPIRVAVQEQGFSATISVQRGVAADGAAPTAPVDGYAPVRHGGATDSLELDLGALTHLVKQQGGRMTVEEQGHGHWAVAIHLPADRVAPGAAPSDQSSAGEQREHDAEQGGARRGGSCRA